MLEITDSEKEDGVEIVIRKYNESGNIAIEYNAYCEQFAGFSNELVPLAYIDSYNGSIKYKRIKVIPNKDGINLRACDKANIANLADGIQEDIENVEKYREKHANDKGYCSISQESIKILKSKLKQIKKLERIIMNENLRKIIELKNFLEAQNREENTHLQHIENAK